MAAYKPQPTQSNPDEEYLNYVMTQFSPNQAIVAGIKPSSAFSGLSPMPERAPINMNGLGGGGGVGGVHVGPKLSPTNSNGRNRPNTGDLNQDLQRSLYENRMRTNQQNQLDLEKQRQEQALKMEMLQKIIGQFKASTRRGGGEGYTEQIFNNAGRPQVVRLKNQEPGQQEQMLMQLLSRFGG